MAFNVGDKVLVSVQTGTVTLVNQPGFIRGVLSDSMYVVFVVGLLLTLPEADLQPAGS